MKSMRLIAPVLVAVCLLVVPLAWSQGGNVEQEIRSLIDQTKEANLKADASFFEKHYADDATIIHSDGSMSTKAQEIESFKSGAVKYESLDIREVKVRAYGDTAIQNLLTAVKANIHGKAVSSIVRDSRVWVKEDGIWKCVAFQATRVAPASK